MNLKDLKLIIFDFDGVFTDNKVIVSEDGKESVVCNRSDGIGLSMLKNLGIELMILSTEVNSVVQKRADKLKIKCYHGVENKLLKFQELCKDYRLNEVAFVGNDINDIVLLEKVGVSVAVNDAYEPVKKICNIILKKNGGEGAVREFCEMVYKAKEEI